MKDGLSFGYYKYAVLSDILITAMEADRSHYVQKQLQLMHNYLFFKCIPCLPFITRTASAKGTRSAEDVPVSLLALQMKAEASSLPFRTLPFDISADRATQAICTGSHSEFVITGSSRWEDSLS